MNSSAGVDVGLSVYSQSEGRDAGGGWCHWTAAVSINALFLNTDWQSGQLLDLPTADSVPRCCHTAAWLWQVGSSVSGWTYPSSHLRVLFGSPSPRPPILLNLIRAFEVSVRDLCGGFIHFRGGFSAGGIILGGKTLNCYNSHLGVCVCVCGCDHSVTVIFSLC